MEKFLPAVSASLFGLLRPERGRPADGRAGDQGTARVPEKQLNNRAPVRYDGDVDTILTAADRVAPIGEAVGDEGLRVANCAHRVEGPDRHRDLEPAGAGAPIQGRG